MQFPYVSRETLRQETALRDQQIRELKAENKRLEEKVWKLSDELVYRHSSRHMDPALEQRPATVAEPAKPEGPAEIPTAVERAARTAGSKVRAALNTITAQNMSEWAKEERTRATLQEPLSPMPAQPIDQALAKEAIDKIAGAITEGRAAAAN